MASKCRTGSQSSGSQVRGEEDCGVRGLIFQDIDFDLIPLCSLSVHLCWHSQVHSPSCSASWENKLLSFARGGIGVGIEFQCGRLDLGNLNASYKDFQIIPLFQSPQLSLQRFQVFPIAKPLQSSEVLIGFFLLAF